MAMGFGSHFLQILQFVMHETPDAHLEIVHQVGAKGPYIQMHGSRLTFLQRYHNEGNVYLNRIVMSDEIWVAHFNQETKQHSNHLVSQWIFMPDQIQVDYPHKM